MGGYIAAGFDKVADEDVGCEHNLKVGDSGAVLYL